jgi:hypothetical protein
MIYFAFLQVNRMCSSLMEPVRSIVDVTTAVAKGDLTQLSRLKWTSNSAVAPSVSFLLLEIIFVASSFASSVIFFSLAIISCLHFGLSRLLHDFLLYGSFCLESFSLPPGRGSIYCSQPPQCQSDGLTLYNTALIVFTGLWREYRQATWSSKSHKNRSHWMCPTEAGTL